MEDQLAATRLATKAYAELKAVNPEHELVKIMEAKGEGGDDAFIERFWDKDDSWKNHPGSMVSMYVETKYFTEVKKILKEEYNIEL